MSGCRGEKLKASDTWEGGTGEMTSSEGEVEA